MHTTAMAHLIHRLLPPIRQVQIEHIAGPETLPAMKRAMVWRSQSNLSFAAVLQTPQILSELKLPAEVYDHLVLLR